MLSLKKLKHYFDIASSGNGRKGLRFLLTGAIALAGIGTAGAYLGTSRDAGNAWAAPAGPTPYHGKPIGEGQRIAAADYDLGGPLVAYKDTTPANRGNANYRTNEQVDIVLGGETGRVVGFAVATEYLRYTISVPTTGPYTVLARVSNLSKGGVFHISFDNGKILSDRVAVPITKSWDIWQTVSTARLNLTAGTHVMQVNLDTNSAASAVANFDWFRITQAAGPASFGWKAGTPSPYRRFEGYARVVNGRLYEFGGYTAVNPFGVNENANVYDPATNKWTDLGKAPIPETHAGVAVDAANGWVYFVGGLVGLYDGPPTTAVWKYDANANKWSQLTSLPFAVAAGSAALVNGQLHYFGGIRAGSRSLDYNTHLYIAVSDLLANKGKWASGTAFPTARDHFTAETVGNKVYVFGGEIGHDTLHLQQYEVDIFDPSTGNWTRGTDSPIARSHAECSTFVTDDGKIVIGGGQVDDFKPTAYVFQYDPILNHWTSLAPLPLPLEGTVFQKIGSKVFVSDGYDAVTANANNQTYIGTWGQ